MRSSASRFMALASDAASSAQFERDRSWTDELGSYLSPSGSFFLAARGGHLWILRASL